MAAQTPILIDRCVQCSQPASQVCGGCSNAPDIGDKITEETSYCSTECQSANWPTHETACKRLQTRKALYRAGNTLQEIFYIYREKLFDRPVDRIEVTGTLEERNMKMRIYETEWPQIVTNYDFIQPFPSSMCNSLEEKQALLTYLTCSDAIGSMHDLIEYMLADIVSSFMEISVMPNNRNLVVIAISPSGTPDPEYPHDVLRVQLKQGGECFIMDLAAAQHGHFKPIIPETEYITLQVASYFPRGAGLESQYFGWAKNKHIEAAKTTPILDLHRKIWSQLKGYVQEWEEESKITVQAMLQLPDAVFELRQKEFIEYLGARLQQLLGIMAERDARYKALKATADGRVF